MSLNFTQASFSKSILYVFAVLISFGCPGLQQANAVCTGPSGTISVGPTGTYSTLTAAIAATSAGISGNVIFELQSTYTSSGETFPLTFPANACVDATHTITVRPVSGASGLSITSANATATIDLNGAAYITIDGRPGGTGTTSQLTISNTSTGPGVAIRLINDAVNNTVTYCTLLASTTSLGVVSFSTGTVTGNDNNTISNNNISLAGTNTPLNGIYSAGTSAAIDNSGNTITSNNIFDVFSATASFSNINISSASSAWTITGNRIFGTAAGTVTTANINYGIFIGSGNGYTISNNIIGYGSSAATGVSTLNSTAALTYTAINGGFTAGAPASSIQGNTIAAITITTSGETTSANGNLCGINITSGDANIGTVTGNTIGAASGTGSLNLTSTTTGALLAGINTSSTGVISIQNNTMGAWNNSSITAAIGGAITGINVSGVAASMNISNNIIGNTTTDNMQAGIMGTTTANSLVSGINLPSTPSGTITIANNTIRNLSAYGTGTGGFVRGIWTGPAIGGTSAYIISGNTISNLITSSGLTTISNGQVNACGLNLSIGNNSFASQNTIFNISNINTASTGSFVAGITLANATNTTVNRNTIYGITNAGTSTTTTAPSIAAGIIVRSGTTAVTIINNMISLGTGQTTNTAFLGIQCNHGATPDPTNNIYFNSINIEGSVSSGAQPSFGIARTDFLAARTAPMVVKNNIVTNTRSGGSGAHYAIANNYGATATATGWPAGASNFNVLNAASATVGYWSGDQTFSGWKTASNSDANSLSGITVTYVNTATANLHLNFGTTATPIESGGTAIAGITTDYDNQVRPGPTGSVNGGACLPDIGADEFDGVRSDLFGPVITYTALSNTSCISPAIRILSPVTITDCSNVNITSGTKPRLYYKKSSDANTYAGNTSTNNGWKYVEASNTSSPFSFTIDYSLLQSAVAATDVIQYFVVAQDISATPNVSINSGIFTAAPSSVALTAAAFPLTGTINSYTILPPGLSGNITIGATGTYTSLTGTAGLFNAINTVGLAGNLTATITDASVTESGTIALNNISVTGCTPGTFTVLIKPQAALAATLTGNNATALIKLNGADGVTFDGLNTGGSSLKIINTNTAGTMIWIGSASATDGANNDTIKNCSIAGISTTGSIAGILAGSGITFGNPADASNSGNVIQGNTFTAAQNGIYISGQATTFDQAWLIDGNTFGSASVAADKLSYRGMSLQGVNNFTISNNIIRGVVTTATSTTTGISIFVTATNGNIFNNKISDIKNTNATGFGSNGIALSGTSTASNITVYNNFISDVASIGFNGYAIGDNGYGIVLNGGGGYNIYHNTVLMNTDQTVTTGNPAAINITSGIITAASVNVRDNIFANTQTVGTNRYAIISTAAANVFTDINYNDYYNGAAPNLGYFNGNTATLAAWRTATGKDLQSINVAPVFVAPPADLHLSNAAGANWCLNGTGTAIASVTTDIDAQIRTTPPDIGADEFTPTDNSAATPVAQTSCSGSAVTPIVLSGVASSFSWTRNNTASVTGIAASGTGNISGTLTNTTNAPVTVTFTITPLNVNGCTFGSTITATVVVNPVPNIVTTPSSQAICSGSAIAAIVNSGNVAGTVYSWTRDNTASVTGIGASGAGNISGTLTNITALPVLVTFTITPSYAACTGTATIATVTVNPANTITLNSAAGTDAQTVCINTAITNITYATVSATGATITGLPAGVSGSWAANVVTISGIPTASGTFNYTITLTGGCGGVVTATGTITVTPNNAATLSSAAGTNTQTVCINTPITNIIYTTTGATGATFSGLPAGVTGSWAANVATISGTPTASGTYNYTITLTGGCGTSTATGSVTVTPANTITLSSTPGTIIQSVCVNTAIANITYTTTGATGASFTGLPAGVSGSWAANVVTISGTPTTAGTFNYTVTLTGGCGTVTATATISATNTNTVTLSSAAGTNTQTRCINTPITNITYTTAGAAGATFSGLPPGVSGIWAANMVTISGTPTTSGTFNYTVTLTGGCSGVVTTTGTVVVITNNTVTLSSATGTNAQTRCINTAIANITYATTGATGATFTGLPPGVSGSWTANVATISGSPTASGAFSYTVTLTGGCGIVATTGSITVTPANTATLSSAAGTNAQTVCINTPIANITYATTGATGATFTGLPAGVSGSWAANVATITGTPIASGTFSYTVTLASGCGTVTAPGSIIVTPNNTIALTSGTGTNAQTRCMNSAITNITYASTGATGATFTGLPVGVSGVWAANVVTISGSPTASGTFNYTVTLTGGCGIATATGTITVNPLPVVSISPAIATICAGSSITLTAGGASTYLWSPVTGLSASTGASVVASPAGTITYNVTGTDANGCASAASRLVTVNSLPSITITPTGPISFCQGLSTTLSAFGAATYSWSPATGLSSTTGSSVVASPPSTTTYTVTGTGANGCISTATKTITILPAPDATITPSGYINTCQDDTVFFTATPGYASYVWMLYGVPVQMGASNSYPTFTGGFYTLKVTDAGGCTAITSAASVITVTQRPIPDITEAGGNLDAGAGFSSYQWYIGGVIIPGATGRTYVPTAGGSYTVLVTDTTALHCSGKSEAYIYMRLGVNSYNIADAIKLYPNPANDLVHIDAPVHVNVTVSSMDGKQLFSGRDIREINIGAFADGVYRVLITDKNGKYLKTEKITKVTR